MRGRKLQPQPRGSYVAGKTRSPGSRRRDADDRALLGREGDAEFPHGLAGEVVLRGVALLVDLRKRLLGRTVELNGQRGQVPVWSSDAEQSKCRVANFTPTIWLHQHN